MFDLVAAHLSLILQTYYRVQNRVFSDVAHAIGGGLGRAYQSLTILKEISGQTQRDPLSILKFFRRHLHSPIEMMDKACARLNIVLDASRDPERQIAETVGNLWKSLVTEVELKAHVSLDSSKVILDLQEPLSMDTRLHLRSIQYHDLITILGNLLDNAIRYAAAQEPATVSIMVRQVNGAKQLVFQVVDQGCGIPIEMLEAVKETPYTEIYRLPGTRIHGTGLRRVFALANHYHWQVLFDIQGGTRIEVVTPDFRVTA